MKRILLFLHLILIGSVAVAQDFSLIHSGTAYDAFENPVQPSFVQEKSRKYSLNILPSISADFAFKGDAEEPFRNLIFGEKVRNASISSSDFNFLDADFNIYLVQFRIYKDWKYHKEMGFSLQIRNQTQAHVPNSAIAFINTYKNFGEGDFNSIFNGTASNQLFYQLGFSYRENFNKKWAFGGKVSLLAGVLYSDIRVDRSDLTIENENLVAHFSGEYTSSFGTKDPQAKMLIPSLKNPGASLNLGTSYTTKNNYYLSLNLKDLGFIRWNDSTSRYDLRNTEISVSTLDGNVQKEFKEGFGHKIKEGLQNRSKTSLLSPQLTFAASKHFGQYHPVLVLDQVFLDRQQTRLALLNNYAYRRLNLSLNGFYHFDYGFNVGTQIMIKSENTEFYIGSEKLVPTQNLAKSYINNDSEMAGNAPIAANFYLGLNIKFGWPVQSPPHSDFIDGLNDAETGFIYRMDNKERRKAKKEAKKKR